MTDQKVVAPRTCWWQVAAPAAMVSAGYVDPGNWGTDVAAGVTSAGRLLWVLVLAVLAALLIQQFAMRVGLVTGQDLAGLMRSRLPRSLLVAVRPGIVTALLVTEIVEVFGVVIAVQLLTGWPVSRSVLIGAGLVLLVTVAPAVVGRRCVFGCLAVIGSVYLLLLAEQLRSGALTGLRPQALRSGELPIAIGLIGSIVMPHNVLLQSMMARDVAAGSAEVPGLLRRSLGTTAVALAIAFAVNTSIMLLAATVSRRSGGDLSGTFGDVHAGYGRVAAVIFALTLLGAGLASSVTGGIATSDVMLTFLPRLRLPPQLRRLCCLIPAIAVAASGLPVMLVLVWSQVVLALALPLVLLPLLWFVTRPDVMGTQLIGWPSRCLGAAVTFGLVVAGLPGLA